MAYIGNSPTNIQRGRRAVYEFTASAGQTAFSGVDNNGLTLDLLDSNENDVYLNGARLVLTDDYTISGDTLTLVSAAALNDILIIVTQDDIANAGSYTKAESDSRYINYSGDIINGDLQVVGNVSLCDNNKINLGGSSDLQIFHDGSDGFITNDTGQLILRVASVESALVAVPNGAVSLYHDNSPKLSTTSTGVDVSGVANINTTGTAGDGKLRVGGLVDITTTSGGAAYRIYDGVDFRGGIGDGGWLGTGDIGDFGIYVGSTAKKMPIHIGSSTPIGTFTSTGLGIGTASPSAKINTSGAVGAINSIQTQVLLSETGTNTGTGLQIKANNSTYSWDAGAITFLREGAANSYALTFDTSSGGTDSEAMRIDSSGNLLVGQSSSTQPGVGNTTIGFGIRNDGLFFASAYQGRTGTFSRSGSDGDVLGFYRAGARAGSIGVTTNLMTIMGKDGDGGLAIQNNSFGDIVYPASNSSGGASNGAIDLGYDNGRWKDLYLSGGVYLGGTGPANKLDDYEEGTWTPSFTYSGGNPATVSYNTRTGYYTKIGNICHYTCDVRLTAFSRGSATGTLQLQGLPFPTKNHFNYARPNSVPNLYQWPYQTDAGYQPMFGMLQDGVAKGDFSMMRPNAASTQVNDPDGDSMLFLTGWYYTT